MRKYILSDLHIGHKTAQYDVMDRMIAYIRANAQPGDEIWGLGDWFHMYENGVENCLRHPMTQKFRDLAREIPTKLVPGNHDHELEKYRDNPALGNPISPISIIEPFMDNDLWYCHGHEHDPSVQYIPRPFMWMWNHMPRKKTTPGNVRRDRISREFLILVYLVHSRALLSLAERVEREHSNCKGIVLGHTHLPMLQESSELLFLLNDGDMRQSATFTIEDDDNFHQMKWDFGNNNWREINIPRPGNYSSVV